MAHQLSSFLLARLATLVATELGLHFPKERWRDLERGVSAAAREFGFTDVVACSQWLAGHLTVGETYFFREKTLFDILKREIFPALIHRRRRSERRLRIWSAGCCTGEEPYSIAILLSQLLPDWQHWDMTILATDVNMQFLHKARMGVYGRWSFRGVAPSIREQYFTPTETGHFAISPQIKQRVTFAWLNLAAEDDALLSEHAGAMDIIFCCNVLMYFTPEQTQKVIHRLHRLLAPGGWLVVSPTEAAHKGFAPFTRVLFPNAVLYQKSDNEQGEQADSPVHFTARAELSEQFPLLAASTAPALPEEDRPTAFAAPGSPQLGDLHPAETAVGLQPHRAAEAQQQAPSTLYSEAVAIYERGDYAAAEERVIAWLASHPKAGNALLLLACICANQGRLDDALHWCEQAIAADRCQPECYYLLATIQEERNQIKDALRALQRALYLDPNFVLAHFALGSLSRRLGQFAKAEKHFTIARALLRTYPRDALLPAADGLTARALMDLLEAIPNQSD
jgi:chemotaxis protein methyltransferase CheR